MSADGACDDGEFIWQYDPYGNLLNDGTSQYTYDAAMRLKTVTAGGTTTTYTYNGDGGRVAQTVGSTTTTYVLDTATPLTMVLAETTGATTIYYLHGLDLVAQSDGASAEYLMYDGLGSVRQVVTGTSSILMAQTFDPYGNLFGRAGAEESSFGFTNEYTDATGLLYLRARYYDPRTGHFFQMDPSRREKNPYQYGLSNPVNYSDPSGEVSVYIWASTFIASSTVTFPHVYDLSKVAQIPPGGIDWNAQWHGDGRGFYTGGSPRFGSAPNRSARLYHEIEFDTNSIDNYTSVAGSGITWVNYVDDQGNPGFRTAQAKAPAPATITRRDNTIYVLFFAMAGDPLVYVPAFGVNVPLAPPARYFYGLTLNLDTGQYVLTGVHALFPSYEIYVELGGSPLITVQRNPPVNSLFTLGVPVGLEVNESGFEPSLLTCE